MNKTIQDFDRLISDLSVLAERCKATASLLDDIRSVTDDIIRAKTEIVSMEANQTEDDDKQFLEYCKRLLARKEGELKKCLKNKEHIEANLRVINEFGRSVKTELPEIDTEYDI